jgi:hypothetical protein
MADKAAPHDGKGEGLEHGTKPTEGMNMPPPPQTGGRRRRGRKGGRKSRKGSRKGGQGVIATAAVPFGLLALQRFFKGSRAAKGDVRSIGSSFKRTFRLPRKASRKTRRRRN